MAYIVVETRRKTQIALSLILPKRNESNVTGGAKKVSLMAFIISRTASNHRDDLVSSKIPFRPRLIVTEDHSVCLRILVYDAGAATG